MTKAQKKMMQDKLLGLQRPFSVLDLTTPGSFSLGGGWHPNRKDKLKILGELLDVGTIELVSEGAPIPLGGGEGGGAYRMFQMVHPRE